MAASKQAKPAIEEEEGPENSLRKLAGARGVQSYVILNRSGIPVKFHGMEQADALQYAALLSELTLATQLFLSSHLNSPAPSAAPAFMNNLSPDECELVTLRLKSRQHEIIVAPDENFTLITVHGNGNVPAAGQSGQAAAGGEKATEEKKAAPAAAADSSD